MTLIWRRKQCELVRICLQVWLQDARLPEVMVLGKQSQITAEEAEELERLIGLVDHQMVLRSEALLLWKRRGPNVEQRLKLGA